ncbi:hypothetical protein pipiens_002213 [Culex pipiens pipiens]|uniref:Uncharacterized protein n=1 Tax=Culex pipiens pipiens TaxID=38569 RepID=A0ABD1DIK1_CULPP
MKPGGQTNYASLRNGNFVCLSIRVWSEMELFSKLFDLNQAETWKAILNAVEEEQQLQVAKEEAFFKIFQRLVCEDEQYVGELLPEGLLGPPGSRQQTAVHLVASRQTGTATAILRALLTAAGKDIRAKTDGKGKIPLLLAVEAGNQSMCRELLSAQTADQLKNEKEIGKC